MNSRFSCLFQQTARYKGFPVTHRAIYRHINTRISGSSVFSGKFSKKLAAAATFSIVAYSGYKFSQGSAESEVRAPSEWKVKAASVNSVDLVDQGKSVRTYNGDPMLKSTPWHKENPTTKQVRLLFFWTSFVLCLD